MKIEIRLNSNGKAKECFVCKNARNEDEEIFFDHSSDKVGYPDLFVEKQFAENGFVCSICAGLEEEASLLLELVRIARTIDNYYNQNVEKLVVDDDLAENKFAYDISIKNAFIPQTLDKQGNAKCLICKEFSYFEKQKDFEKPKPNLCLNEEIVCNICGEIYANKLQSLLYLATDAENLVQCFTFQNNNSLLNATLDKLGWITCPNCEKRFSIKDKNRWKYNRHLTCGQKIIISER
jgi:hypothetical protein